MTTFSKQTRGFSLPERLSVAIALLVLSVLAMSGCKSKQDEAVDMAKQTAIATGQPQQVTSVDKKGNTIVAVVRPPAPGQKEATVVTTTIPPGADPSMVPGATTGFNGMSGSTTATTATTKPEAVDPVIAPLDVRIPAGTTLPIRLNQTISVKHTHAGDRFSGTMAESIREDGKVVVPRGTPVSGVVSAAKKRGHFKGHSYLSLRLTSMTLNGTSYQLETGRSTSTKHGKGRRSTAWIGGTAGVGMLVGGIATGGVGLLAGGLAGGGLGTLIAGTTGNHDITLPAESVVRFKLSESLSVVPAQ